MVPVNDLEDVSKTLEMENIQLLSSFHHLPGFARVGHCQHNDRGQEPKFNLQGEFQIGRYQAIPHTASPSEEFMLPR